MPALASLLLNSGFHDVTLDHDEIRILYPGLREILYDLQVLGESSAIIARHTHLSLTPTDADLESHTCDVVLSREPRRCTGVFLGTLVEHFR